MHPIADAKAYSSPTQTVQATAREFGYRFGFIKDDASEGDNVKGYVHATALLRVLKELGLAEQVGTADAPKGKGKGAAIWKVPSQILFNM